MSKSQYLCIYTTVYLHHDRDNEDGWLLAKLINQIECELVVNAHFCCLVCRMKGSSFVRRHTQ